MAPLSTVTSAPDSSVVDTQDWWKHEIAIPGSTVWRVRTSKDYVQRVQDPSWRPVVDLWTTGGRTEKDLIASLVASEEQALTAEPVWIAS